ncbi:MAG: MBL fold metallo-hydrolase [Verrucomicrobiota bacterium]|jgi:phosphoribosyl 1,2-cyclic phosphodiesterase|nr:MBL fold metallo-hydrolase [Verrucomicrobiota bacterium]
MRLCVLASGSSGNCIYVETAETAILIDAGLSAKETFRRMDLMGLCPSRLCAICITHEHTDHTAGAARLRKLLDIPLYATSACAQAVRGTLAGDWICITNGSPFRIGDIELQAFTLPHDAYDPVGFILICEGIRIGIATDLGMPTQLVRERLRGCHLLILEANHDEELVRSSRRPWHLKQRILGIQGHLSNTAAASLLAEIAGNTLQDVFLAHLSSECNRLDLALHTIRNHLLNAGLERVQVHPTHQDRPSIIKII